MESFGDDLFDIFEEHDSDADDQGTSLPTPQATKAEPDALRVSDENTALTSQLKRKYDREEIDGKKQKTETILDDINVTIKHNFEVLSLDNVESCIHEVVLPAGAAYCPLNPLGNKVAAKEYKFTLDSFQKEAITCIENSQSVLVSAHTSAGKTVVAEYSIAMSLRDKQRVIYTTPIKALSNQKFREFAEEFEDVGLITGDVTINPSASCLVMTTEILRNMLYRGSEVMREVGWVIFDEIHYMRDKERGVVWEETLILLPHNVHFVFLSATIPNARQFAEWVVSLHNQPCHVVYTDYRPVPLQHYLFPAGGEGIHLVVDEQGQFKEDNFNKAITILHNSGDAAKGDQPGRKGGIRGGGESNIYKIVKMVMEHHLSPLIVFSFSKKSCETYALQMAKLDLNSGEERKLVDEVFTNALSILSSEDRKLPQIENMLPLLRRGIAVHHGGLLPILKETIEILFGEGLIKALFATETFAMGLNMPARTVIFTAPRKFDGKDFRYITSGEYIQMSGRAGRRGLDDKGTVILMIDEKVSSAVCRTIIQGLPDPINSAFHLSYNMVLNLLRVEEINPEYMLEKSFYQFQNQSAISSLNEKIQKLGKEHQNIYVPKEDLVEAYFKLKLQLKTLSAEYCTYITKPEHIKRFLQPGRMIKVKLEGNEFEWGVLIDHKISNDTDITPNKGISEKVIVNALLHVESDNDPPKPCPANERGEMRIVSFSQDRIMNLSTVRLYFQKDLKPPDNRWSVHKSIQETKRRFPNGIPLLDPVTHMNIKHEDFLEVLNSIKLTEERLKSLPLVDDPDLDKLYVAYSKKYELSEEIKLLKQQLKKAKSLLQMDELRCRKRVLKRLNFCSAADVIEVKGRVACELSSGDELLLTEMIFNGLFSDLSVSQCVALLSCFVCDEKSTTSPKLSEELAGPLRQMQDLARRIAQVSADARMEITEDVYVNQFKPFLMDVFYAWSNGSSFLEICKMTDIFEGSIVRCMRRLEEILCQLCAASKNIGNIDLENKFTEAIHNMKRGVVFAASLYL